MEMNNLDKVNELVLWRSKWSDEFDIEMYLDNWYEHIMEEIKVLEEDIKENSINSFSGFNKELEMSSTILYIKCTLEKVNYLYNYEQLEEYIGWFTLAEKLIHFTGGTDIFQFMVTNDDWHLFKCYLEALNEDYVERYANVEFTKMEKPDVEDENIEELAKSIVDMKSLLKEQTRMIRGINKLASTVYTKYNKTDMCYQHYFRQVDNIYTDSVTLTSKLIRSLVDKLNIDKSDIAYSWLNEDISEAIEMNNKYKQTLKDTNAVFNF